MGQRQLTKRLNELTREGSTRFLAHNDFSDLRSNLVRSHGCFSWSGKSAAMSPLLPSDRWSFGRQETVLRMALAEFRV
jgi:hypothetical protein